MEDYFELVDKYKAGESIDPTEYTNLAATLAFAEDYETFERFLAETRDFNVLNACTNERFATTWQPTPLFLITSPNVRTKMKDPQKMVRFLAAHGVDVNIAAGDGTTPLSNLLHDTDPTSLEFIKLFLELGADPNKTSLEGENELPPLLDCLDRKSVV